MGRLAPPVAKPVPPASDIAVHRHAAGLLCGRGIAVEEILHVSRDSVLFFGSRRRLLTAWIVVDPGGRVLAIACETGYPAEPSGHALRFISSASRPGPSPRTHRLAPALSRDQALDDLDAADFDGA